MKFNYLKAILLVYFLFGIINMAPIKLYSQNNKIDSLKNIVLTNKKDSTAVYNLIALSKAYLEDENIEKSLVFSEQALNLAKQIGFNKGIAIAYKQIGLAHYYSGNFFLSE